MKRISLLDVKEALRDKRFRDRLPEDFKPEVIKFLNNPACACNLPLYRKILNEQGPLLSEFYPGAEIISEAEEVKKLAQNHWSVINCNISELETKMRALPPGRKQVTVSRFQDQATVIINELDVYI